MTIPLQCASLYVGQVFVWSDCLLDLGTDFLVGNVVVHLISIACIFVWSSAVRVHDSRAYRKMGVTKERISRILELKEISCYSKLVSTLSMLLLSVLSWRMSQVWNPHQL